MFASWSNSVWNCSFHGRAGTFINSRIVPSETPPIEFEESCSRSTLLSSPPLVAWPLLLADEGAVDIEAKASAQSYTLAEPPPPLQLEAGSGMRVVTKPLDPGSSYAPATVAELVKHGCKWSSRPIGRQFAAAAAASSGVAPVTQPLPEAQSSSYADLQEPS